jgi:hypothetical protein
MSIETYSHIQVFTKSRSCSSDYEKICTHEQCEIPDRTYDSRREWFHHEMQVHRKWWECIQGCSQTFTSFEQLQGHFWLDHPNLAENGRMGTLIRSCERNHDMTDADKVACPLCSLKNLSFTTLRRHLGRHLEELALFALPSRLMGDHEESHDEGDDDNPGSLPSFDEDVVSLVASSSDIGNAEDTTNYDGSLPPDSDTSPIASITNVNGQTAPWKGLVTFESVANTVLAIIRWKARVRKSREMRMQESTPSNKEDRTLWDPPPPLDTEEEEAWLKAKLVTLRRSLLITSAWDHDRSSIGKFEFHRSDIRFYPEDNPRLLQIQFANLWHARAVASNKVAIQGWVYHVVDGIPRNIEGSRDLIMTFSHEKALDNTIVRLLKERTEAIYLHRTRTHSRSRRNRVRNSGVCTVLRRLYSLPRHALSRCIHRPR